MCHRGAAASTFQTIFCLAAGARSQPVQPMSWVGCSGTSRRTRSVPNFISRRRVAYLHPQWDARGRNRVNRPITHLEAARLQGFPDNFLWCGSKIEIARQIGNAVPVSLAQAIAKHLKLHL